MKHKKSLHQNIMLEKERKRKYAKIGLITGVVYLTLMLGLSVANLVATCNNYHQRDNPNVQEVKSMPVKAPALTSIPSPFVEIPKGTYKITKDILVRNLGYDITLNIYNDSVDNYASVYYHSQLASPQGYIPYGDVYYSVRSGQMSINHENSAHLFSMRCISLTDSLQTYAALGFNGTSSQKTTYNTTDYIIIENNGAMGVSQAYVDWFVDKCFAPYLSSSKPDLSFDTLKNVLEHGGNPNYHSGIMMSDSPLTQVVEYYQPYWYGTFDFVADYGTIPLNTLTSVYGQPIGVYIRWCNAYASGLGGSSAISVANNFAVACRSQNGTINYLQLGDLYKRNSGGVLDFKAYTTLDYLPLQYANVRCGQYVSDFVDLIGVAFNPNTGNSAFDIFFGIIMGTFTPILYIFSLQVFPGITLGTIILVPIVIGLIVIIIHIVRGK